MNKNILSKLALLVAGCFAAGTAICQERDLGGTEGKDRRNVMASKITRLNPPSLPDPAAFGYSQISIVEPGRMAYVSGQVAWRRDGQPVPDDLKEQIKIATDNAKGALEALGAKPKDIVMARLFVVNLTPERLEALFPTLLEFFNGEAPSLTGIGVAALAAPELQVELEFTVRVPD